MLLVDIIMSWKYEIVSLKHAIFHPHFKIEGLLKVYQHIHHNNLVQYREESSLNGVVSNVLWINIVFSRSSSANVSNQTTVRQSLSLFMIKKYEQQTLLKARNFTVLLVIAVIWVFFQIQWMY